MNSPVTDFPVAGTFVLRNALHLGRPTDVFVQAGHIAAAGPANSLDIPHDVPETDAEGLILLPSLIDCHAHFREPGQEYKEDIASGLSAAAHGGFGAVFCMGNTKPVNDTAAVTRLMLESARRSWPEGPRLHPVGAATVGLAGTEMAPLAELAAAGCIAFSNDGRPVEQTELLRRCVEYAADLGRIVIDHCEDLSLAKGAIMNEGKTSGRLGLKGQPDVGEAVQVARDILLAEYLALPIHLAHISCRRSVELIAWAKSRNVPVTAETCPHYLLLTEEELVGYSSNSRVNPPLRTADDAVALRQAVKDGTIDMLVTDHAPHAAHEKEVALDDAPSGISGLDTALTLTWNMVANKTLCEADVIRLWLTNPARIFKLPANTFTSGDPADFLLFDPNQAWRADPQSFFSKSANTPWLGRELTGRTHKHWLNGVPIAQI